MPYNIIKNGSKYELRLEKNNQLLGTHKTKKEANKQIQAIEINKTGRLNPDLYEKAKKMADEKYGLKHSARKQQQITRIYKDVLGGEYTDDLKPNQKSLKKWTAQDWGRDIPEGRYLPKKIREELTPDEYLRTSLEKMRGTLKGQQYVKQPEDIVKKIRKLKGGEKPFKIIKGYKYFVSDKPEKKLMVDVNGKRLYFGATGYEQYKDKTGLLNPDTNHLDKTRRNRYLMRAKNIKDKEGNLTYLDPESPNYHAVNILW